MGFQKGHTLNLGKRRSPNKLYYKVNLPEHPYARGHGTVPLHRLIIENKLGRYLLPHELVHHINGDIHDNRLENLKVMIRSEHFKVHRIDSKMLKGRMQNM